MRTNKVCTCLENIDRFMDRWGLSPINNLVNCITKACIGVCRWYYADESKLMAARNKAFLGHYFTYIDKKDGEMCIIGLIPALGTVLFRDLSKKPVYKDVVLDLPPTEKTAADCSLDLLLTEEVEENYSTLRSAIEEESEEEEPIPNKALDTGIPVTEGSPALPILSLRGVVSEETPDSELDLGDEFEKEINLE